MYARDTEKQVSGARRRAAVAAHPGMAKSGLAKHVTKKLLYRIGTAISSVMSQSSSMGALPVVMASTGPLVKGGEFFGPGGFQEWRGYPVKGKIQQSIA